MQLQMEYASFIIVTAYTSFHLGNDTKDYFLLPVSSLLQILWTNLLRAIYIDVLYSVFIQIQIALLIKTTFSASLNFSKYFHLFTYHACMDNFSFDFWRWIWSMALIQQ